MMFGFSMSKEQKMIKEEVAKLVKDIVIDNAHDMDESGEIPVDALQKAWSIGASVSKVPETYGGYGMKDSPVETAIILEELAYGDMSFAIAATLPALFIFPLAEMGNEEQKKKYLPLYCREKYLPCTMAVNEPRFGFDVADFKTTAVKKNGSYVLNGSKCFVPAAKEADHMMVAACLDGKNELFIVDRNNPGIRIGEREKNIGLYPLKTYQVELKACEIPAVDRLGGADGCDFDKIVQKMRVALSAIGTGVSRASYEFTKDYAKDRVQFGEPIVYRQTVAFMIAEMAYEVEAMRLLTWKAASMLESGKDAKREAYLAKIYAGEQTMKITDYGVQLLGGHGYVRDYPVERYYRNGRGIAILEGMAIV
jgi:acyl-CoA dehydrogenase